MTAIRWADVPHTVFVGGVALLLVGAALAFSALGIFRGRSTTTVPFEKSSALVASGPYRFTRNPMELGLTLIYLGVAITRAEVWPAIALPLVLAYLNLIRGPTNSRASSNSRIAPSPFSVAASLMARKSLGPRTHRPPCAEPNWPSGL